VIQLSDLTKSFGDRTLLEHVTWQIVTAIASVCADPTARARRRC
jgi:hypothetical protein